MKKYLLGCVIIAATITSCLKSKDEDNTCSTYDPCAIKAPQSEITAVETYLSDKNITGAVKHCSGMYYKILQEGSGIAPGICSAVLVDYRGEFANGTVFDSTKTGEPAAFTLVKLITGFKNGLPLIKKGGVMQLFVPPTLGYGSADIVGVPPNSMLIFKITLQDLQP